MSICIKEALRIISKNIAKVSCEIVPIENIQDRILAEDIYAKLSLPTFNNSAMDGYAVKLSDVNKEIKIIDTIFAGSEKTTNFEEGQCVKIMTGARIPTSTEAIVPKELTKDIDENTILLPSDIKNNQHVRFTGEDIEKGVKLLNQGDDLNFSSVTILASQGITHVKVYRKPKISVFTSGEELKLHYEKIEDYQLYNSNTPTLLARTQELGADVTFVGMAKDSVASLQEMISNSLYADFIITSGGISVGDADFTKEAFDSFDMETLFDGITIKPGKPTVFGKINNTYILNLPGNPLAAALIFEVFGKIIMQKLSGSKNIYHNTLLAKMGKKLNNKKGRTTIIPGFFDGEFFTASEKRAAGMVGVLHKCNAIMVLNKQNESLEKDALVKILPITWKFFTDVEKDYFN
ncbi:molybdopterin molybdotransferase MoeA [Arcobacteraceae bacterium]|nr:molybdopterin molybdotransferase MoeA [Arcobacteraceae bacterium]